FEGGGLLSTAGVALQIARLVRQPRRLGQRGSIAFGSCPIFSICRGQWTRPEIPRNRGLAIQGEAPLSIVRRGRHLPDSHACEQPFQANNAAESVLMREGCRLDQTGVARKDQAS